MKRLLLIAAFVLTAASLSAQNYIVVNSEKVFKSVSKYNTAITQLDQLAKTYQEQVDAKFREIESLYNNYQEQKTMLSATSRQTREQQILTKEEEATKFQEGIFGTEGSLMKKRVEMIEPIQKEVFAAIETYAQQVGASLVIDSANNPTLLYINTGVNHTDRVISYLKK